MLVVSKGIFTGTASVKQALLVHIGAVLFVFAVGYAMTAYVRSRGPGDGLEMFFPAILLLTLVVLLVLPTLYGVWVCAPNGTTPAGLLLARAYVILFFLTTAFLMLKSTM